MKKNAVSLHRIIQASPEKVFRAFADPVANSYWYPPYGFLCTVQQMDFRQGGKFKMTFTNFSTGNGHSFGGEDRKSTRLNSSHVKISYAVFCLKKKKAIIFAIMLTTY